MATPDNNNSVHATTTNQSGMALSSLEAASFWANIAVVALTVLAAIAGAVALYFASRVGAVKDAALERFQTEAAATIASANARAAEASEGTAKALVGAAKANERAGTLELEASRQQERAAKAELALLELQQRIKPRFITEAQHTILLDALKRASPKGPITLTCVLGDGEGAAFATQIDELLKAAGWPSNGVNQSVYTGGNPIGFGIIVHSAATAPPYATALQKAFAAAGFTLPALETMALAEGTVELVIGNKPQ